MGSPLGSRSDRRSKWRTRNISASADLPRGAEDGLRGARLGWRRWEMRRSRALDRRLRGSAHPPRGAQRPVAPADRSLRALPHAAQLAGEPGVGRRAAGGRRERVEAAVAGVSVAVRGTRGHNRSTLSHQISSVSSDGPDHAYLEIARGPVPIHARTPTLGVVAAERIRIRDGVVSAARCHTRPPSRLHENRPLRRGDASMTRERECCVCYLGAGFRSSGLCFPQRRCRGDSFSCWLQLRDARVSLKVMRTPTPSGSPCPIVERAPALSGLAEREKQESL